MKSNKKTLVLGGTLVTAALTGLFAGSAFADMPSTASGVNSASVASHALLVAGTHAGLVANEAGKHDCKGHNECKGQGGCKTGDEGCKGKNSCKGKGGCNTSAE